MIAFILLEGYHAKNISNEESYYYALLVCMIISVILAIVSLIGLMENGNIKMLVCLVYKQKILFDFLRELNQK